MLTHHYTERRLEFRYAIREVQDCAMKGGSSRFYPLEKIHWIHSIESITTC